jgi:uncharacterized UBP type Zn finger protein
MVTLSVPVPVIAEQSVIGINELLKAYFKPYELEKTCLACAAPKATQSVGLVNVPAVFVVHLNRGHVNDKDGQASVIRTAVNVQETLKVTPFLYNQPFDVDVNPGQQSLDLDYHLTGIVRHIGATIGSGHFVADVHNLSGLYWTRYDDAVVGKISINAVEEQGGRRNSFMVFYRSCRTCV